MATRGSRTLFGVSVRSTALAGLGFAGGSPRSYSSQSTPSQRRLSSADIRRRLPPVTEIDEPILIDIITDLSGSMWGGHDAKGLRHEAALIFLEHLAAARRRGQWFARVTSFDQNSAVELPTTPLDRKGVKAAEVALLGASPGGSSNLGPSFHATEISPIDRRVLVVLSDLELFDADVGAVLSDLANSTATHVLALVFTSSVPQQLIDSRVETHRIDPATSKPADIAHHIANAAAAVAAGVEQTAPSSGMADVDDSTNTVVPMRSRKGK